MAPRHTMLVPLRFLVRAAPPPNPVMGDSYFDAGMRMIRVYDGTAWSGSEDEVAVQPDIPSFAGVELWVDTDESGEGGLGISGGYLPLSGGILTGPLIITPPEGDRALTVSSGGASVLGGALTVDGSFEAVVGEPVELAHEPTDPNHAATKMYVDLTAAAHAGAIAVFTQLYGDGSATTFTVQHDIGYEEVVYSLWDVATKESASAEVRIIDENSLEMRFAEPPAPESVKVVVFGSSLPGLPGGGGGGGGGGGRGNITVIDPFVMAFIRRDDIVALGSGHDPDNMSLLGIVREGGLEGDELRLFEARRDGLEVPVPTRPGDAATKEYVDNASWVAGSAANLIVVNSTDDIPLGTPAGTVIVVSEGAPIPQPPDQPQETPTVEGVTTASTSDTLLLTVAKPAATADGDYLMALVASQSAGTVSDLAAPEGFGRIGPAFLGTNSEKRFNGVYGKRVYDAAAEPSTYTFDLSGTGATVGARCMVMLLALRGVSTLPLEMFTEVGSVSPNENPTIGRLTTTGGSLAIAAGHFMTSIPGNRATATFPPEWTLLGQVEIGDWTVQSTSCLNVAALPMPLPGEVGGMVIQTTGPQIVMDAHYLLVVNGA